MKKRIVATICLILAACAVASPQIAGAQDLEFIGDFCWSEPSGGFVKLGVSRIGPGHLQVNGGVYEPDGTLDSVLSGSGEIAADGIHITAVMSASGPTFVSGVFHILLKKWNLNGTGNSLVNYYDIATQNLDTVYDSRVLTRRACP